MRFNSNWYLIVMMMIAILWLLAVSYFEYVLAGNMSGYVDTINNTLQHLDDSYYYNNGGLSATGDADDWSAAIEPFLKDLRHFCKVMEYSIIIGAVFGFLFGLWTCFLIFRAFKVCSLYR